MTLEDYFKATLTNSCWIDHSVRVSFIGGTTRFYIHPSGKDGLTLDFIVKDNELTTFEEMRIDGTTL